MGVLDKFLDAIKLNEDDDDYLDDDDMLEDEEDEFLDDDLEDSKPRRNSFLGRFSSKRSTADDLDDLDDLDEEDERPVRKAPKSAPPKKSSSRSSSVRSSSRFSSSDLDEDVIQEEPEPKKPAAKPARTSSKITPMRASRRSGASAGNTAVCVIKPASMENTREIVDTLVDNSTVVLNLEGIDMELAQRIIDFTSGATYSLGGTLTRVSSYIFILGPHNVDITGDLQNILGGSSPSVRAGY